MDSQLTICLIIFVLTLVAFILDKIPMWVTATISLLALYATGCLDQKGALAGFSNNNTILMASMFLVAAGFQRTTFVQKLCDKALEVANGSFLKVYAIYILLTVILTNLISSPVATYSVICPLLAALCEKTNTSRTKVMFPALVVSVGCFGLLPLASAVQQASQAQGFITTYGLDAVITPMDYFKAKIPVLILLPIWAIFMGPKVTPENPAIPILKEETSKKKNDKPLTPFQDKMAVIIFFLDILVLVFAGQLGLQPWFIALAGGMLMVLCGALDGRTALKNIPWDMVFLFVGSLGLGEALTRTGAGEYIGGLIVKLVGGTTNNYVLGAIFFIGTFVITQFMQNRAVNLIFTPICLLTCKALDADPVGLLLMVSAGSLSAFLTPMATPAVAICIAEGGYDLKGLFKSGWFVSIMMTIVYIGYTMTMYPAFK